jgi:ribosome-associated translation inhibitor RaiA
MALATTLSTQGIELTTEERSRIDRHLESIEQRLAHRPSPTAALVLKQNAGARLIEASLRVQVGPLGLHLISQQSAETAARAVKLAVDDVERQLERRNAQQRGEATFGVPSRRLPEQRPGPFRGSEPDEKGEPARDGEPPPPSS